MKLIENLKTLIKEALKTETGMTPEEFEAHLPDNCVVIPYITVLNNPNCFIVKSPSPEDFLSFIKEHAKHYDAVYIVKKSLGNNRYNYTNPNFYMGCSVDVG